MSYRLISEAPLMYRVLPISEILPDGNYSARIIFVVTLCGIFLVYESTSFLDETYKFISFLPFVCCYVHVADGY